MEFTGGPPKKPQSSDNEPRLGLEDLPVYDQIVIIRMGVATLTKIINDIRASGYEQEGLSEALTHRTTYLDSLNGLLEEAPAPVVALYKARFTDQYLMPEDLQHMFE